MHICSIEKALLREFGIGCKQSGEIRCLVPLGRRGATNGRASNPAQDLPHHRYHLFSAINHTSHTQSMPIRTDGLAMPPQEEHLVEYFPFTLSVVVEIIDLSLEVFPPRFRSALQRQETKMRENLQKTSIRKEDRSVGMNPTNHTRHGSWDLRFCIQNTHFRLLPVGPDVLHKKLSVCL
jgi:hypothetical protein